MQGQPVTRGNRRYDIDALRAIAFALLILYHAGMFYVADWHWHVKSAHAVEWLQFPMALMHKWRMPLLFLISGLAVNFLLRRSDAGRFAWSRTGRLLIPLLFGMAVIVPPQAYLQAMSNGAFAGNYIEFLAAYFTFQPWPEGAFDGSQIGVTWNHLWYLPYLLAYSLLLAALLPLLRSGVGCRLRNSFRALRGARLILLPALPLAFATWMLRARFPHTHDLIGDWHQHAIFFTVFLYGYWMGADDGLWAELKARRWSLLGVAGLSGVVFGVLLFSDSPPASLWQKAGFTLLEHVYQWSALLAVFAWGHRLLNRPFRWLSYATEAVYPWYVLHQTITVVAGYQLAKYSLGPVVESTLVIGMTVLGCLLLHEYLIRRVNVLRPLFGLKPRQRTSPASGDCLPGSVPARMP
jgi:surface polysaccharide O-acyltransferase-like enzyme